MPTHICWAGRTGPVAPGPPNPAWCSGKGGGLVAERVVGLIPNDRSLAGDIEQIKV